jgi:hypothetical protein
MAALIRHTGTFSLDDRIESPWHYLPVEVPAGAAALRVTLSYPRDSGAVLDLGCFDTDGFRGWSGGARASFVVSEQGATPGYLPGPAGAGLWQVVIGLPVLPAAGVPFSVTAEPLTTSGTALAGALSVAELAVKATQAGLDFVAVTDHNTVSQHACLGQLSRRYGVTLLPGQEVTTSLGHAGVLGDTGWIDFREPAMAWLAAAESAGGLMSVNHPFAGAASWLHPMPRRPPLLEVWHWSWLDLSWTTPLSWWQAWDPAAIPVGVVTVDD